ncbi:MAG: cache domain-containing protein [Deltaproteobacteria bacterium]|nr:cache domain-containing protein [Deltaproteobacteria bacterium]
MERLLAKLNMSQKLMISPLFAALSAVALGALAATQLASASGQGSGRLPLVLVLAAALAAVRTLLIGFAVARVVRSELRRTGEIVAVISSGDLTTRVERFSSDEIGELAEHLNAFVERLRTAMTEVSDGSNHVSAAALSLQSSAERLTAGVEEAASQVNAMSTAGQQMSSTSSEIAQNCGKAAKSADDANRAAVGGEAVIRQALESMERIQETVDGAAGVIRGLRDRSEKIGEIVSLINDIADQTSRLALNAAIEAARAGEHGRGFAVVADEVRKLAERTTRATKEISTTILEIQSETQKAVGSMEHGVGEVQQGAAEARESSDALQDILAQMSTVHTEIGQIAVASEEQTATTNEIALNIQQVSAVMQQTARMLEENTAASSELTALSGQLRKLVSQFRVATREDAKAMVQKAVAYIQTHGKEAALSEFSNQRGAFSKGELFVYAQDLTGTVLAHGGTRAIIGQSHFDQADRSGRYFVREMIQMAKQEGCGWVEYDWFNPATGRVQPKMTFVQRVDDYFVGCGVYR